MKEDENILLKDTCARIPYGLKVKISIDASYDTEFDTISQTCTFDAEVIGCNLDEQMLFVVNCADDEGVSNFIDEYTKDGIPVMNCKPYLRSPSNITKEEQTEFNRRFVYHTEDRVEPSDSVSCVTWLYEHRVDCNGLIKKRLALEAPNDMYNN